ncbi:MAG: hypothetical protein JXA06_07540 [Bacteroidetes bacterium]|nr:hypothetical protein [Bacteroidota bacterium]
MKRIISTALALAVVSAFAFAQADDAGQNKTQLKTREAVKEQVQNVKQAAQDEAPNKGAVKQEAQKINEAVKAQVQTKQAVKQQAKSQTKTKVQGGANFIDKDGDGVCDNNGTKAQKKTKKGSKYGPGDGTGNKGVGPKDGTGFGAGKGAGSGTGTCDGTGPKGTRGGR